MLQRHSRAAPLRPLLSEEANKSVCVCVCVYEKENMPVPVSPVGLPSSSRPQGVSTLYRGTTVGQHRGHGAQRDSGGVGLTGAELDLIIIERPQGRID